MLDMANIGPDDTGIGAYIHIFQDVDSRARHGPRIKVFPGKPKAGNETVIVLSQRRGQHAKVKGVITIDFEVLSRALKFANLNASALVRYWYDSTIGTRELLDVLQRV
jgi:hypothetical protein